MTVKELIELLSKLPPDDPVLIHQAWFDIDGERPPSDNGYSHIRSIQTGTMGRFLLSTGDGELYPHGTFVNESKDGWEHKDGDVRVVMLTEYTDEQFRS